MHDFSDWFITVSVTPTEKGMLVLTEEDGIQKNKGKFSLCYDKRRYDRAKVQTMVESLYGKKYCALWVLS